MVGRGAGDADLAAGLDVLACRSSLISLAAIPPATEAVETVCRMIVPSGAAQEADPPNERPTSRWTWQSLPPNCRMSARSAR